MSSPFLNLVFARASGRCEYCQIPSAYDPLPFQVDHIIARKHGGLDEPDNLALACFSCNNHKGPNIAGVDPETGHITRLFHPRRDTWGEHFLWDGGVLVGLTHIGRTTIRVLAINLDHRVTLREALVLEGVFPPLT